MPEFKYTAKNTDGKAVAGQLTAEAEHEVVAELRRRELTIVSVMQAGTARKSININLPTLKKVKTDELVMFTRQLSTMISAGIPLLECLEVLSEQSENKFFQESLNDVIEKVRTGGDLSESLAAHPKIFTRIFVNMVKAGEASGELDEILKRLAEYYESMAELRREIKAALTYPAVSLFLIFGITIFLMVYIVPQFADIFTSLGTPDKPLELPLATQVLLTISNFMQEQALLWIGGMTALITAIVAYKKTDRGSWQFDWLMLRLPVFGSLFRKVAISRFSRTFSTLIKSGVPIMSALEIVASTSGNRIVEDAVNQAKESVRQGDPLAAPLAQTGVFPGMVTRMISIGEKSGSLENLLTKISEFYDQQVSAAVKSLTSMIEPLLIGVMGGVVGGIVLAIFMPIFKIQSQLAG